MIDSLKSISKSAVVLAVALTGTWAAAADAPRVLGDKLPADQRLQPLQDLDGYFPFRPSATRAAWEARAPQLRRQLLVALGLWPMPAPTSLNAVVHGKVDRDDYTVEKAYFESFPGFFVTGSLYRPKNARAGRQPGVLCPHGHWANGRFFSKSDDELQQEIARGEELFRDGGHSQLQARCVQLARMGCVVFHYDMIGYADSTQISFDIAHRFAKQRPEMNRPQDWGLFSPQAESHLQSVMGLQTYNSIRALDFLTSLPDVDAERIAVTGASGGGTQTFILAALDPRVAVAFPAVMVSTAMQGGCTCENACLLRVETGNVEIAALFAPKPLGLTAANDWTKEMWTKGFPELQQHYRMLGAPFHVFLHSRVEFGHNYNHPSRAAMYSWFNAHLGLGLQEPVEERDFHPLSTAELSVWDDKHPRPPGGDEFERQLLSTWHADTVKQLAQVSPKQPDSLAKYRELVGGAWNAILGRSLPPAGNLEFEKVLEADRGDYLELAGLLRNQPRHEELPIVFLHPKDWNGQVVIWVHSHGKAGLYRKDQLRPEVARLVAEGRSVVGVDLLYQGEFLAGNQTSDKTRRVNNERESAAYTFGYNHTLFAQRVHDILSVVSFVRNHEQQPQKVILVGVEGAGPWVAVARTQAAEAVTLAAVDTGGFRFGQIQEIHDPAFLPGGAKYGDLPGALAVAAPARLWLAGEPGDGSALVRLAYQAASGKDQLTLADTPAAQRPMAAVEWLLQQ